MSYIRKLMGSREVKVSGIRQFWSAMLVPLLVAIARASRLWL